MALLRMPWYARAWRSVTTYARQALGRVSSLRTPPPRLGIATGRAASATRADSDLAAMAASPTVYAAINRIAFGLTVYPIRVYAGYGMGGDPTPLDPERVPWVGSYLRLLARPDPADLDALFPAEPGEHLIAQLVADLKLTGIAYCAPTVTAGGDVIGLTRLHPRCVSHVRSKDTDYLEYRVSGQAPVLYPRRSVSMLRLLSWSADGRSELGTGAAESLAPLIESERIALQQTASMISQGGADIVVTAKDAQGAGFLAVAANRQAVVQHLTTALSGGPDGGRRVFALPANLEVRDAGLSPADLRSPDAMREARTSALMALAVVPVEVGGEASTYATAAIQQRVQAGQDEWLVGLIEAYLLRPLAQQFARRAGGRWAARADQVTARIDLASHPGNIAVRSESIARMRALVELGYSAQQAARAEGIDLPEPEGPPLLGGVPLPPAPASPAAAPPRPAGEAGAVGGAPPTAPAEAAPRTVAQLLGRTARGLDAEAPRLEDSDYERPPYDYVEDIREDWPELWGAGGEGSDGDEGAAGFDGNDAFEAWSRYVDGDRGEATIAWVARREAWAARHYEDFRLPGVIAQLKWGVVGSRGFDHQREIVDEAKAAVSAARAEAEGEDDAEEETRAVAWRAIEVARARSDRDLLTATSRLLREERDEYVTAVLRELEAAARSAGWDSRAPPPGDGGGVEYGAVDLDAVLGDVEVARQRWLDGLSPDWLTTWEEGAAEALNGLDLSQVPPARPVPADLAPLEESAAAAADYSRERVRAIVQDGIDVGRTPQEIASNLMADQGFDRPRAQRIARTETVRAQSSGQSARYAEASRVGVQLELEWVTARDEAVRSTHRPLDRQRVSVGGTWTLPSGATTSGPGLSGVASEDINCRCGRRPIQIG
jgi:hypothetical protein